jgi:hypothetical protein
MAHIPREHICCRRISGRIRWRPYSNWPWNFIFSCSSPNSEVRPFSPRRHPGTLFLDSLPLPPHPTPDLSKEGATAGLRTVISPMPDALLPINRWWLRERRQGAVDLHWTRRWVLSANPGVGRTAQGAPPAGFSLHWINRRVFWIRKHMGPWPGLGTIRSCQMWCKLMIWCDRFHMWSCNFGWYELFWTERTDSSEFGWCSLFHQFSLFIVNWHWVSVFCLVFINCFVLSIDSNNQFRDNSDLYHLLYINSECV